RVAHIWTLDSFPTRRSSDLRPGLLHFPAHFPLNGTNSRCVSSHEIDNGEIAVKFLSPLTWISQLTEGGSTSHVIHTHGLIGGYQDRKSTRLNSSHVSISYAV